LVGAGQDETEKKQQEYGKKSKVRSWTREEEKQERKEKNSKKRKRIKLYT
jgi:hypothetical protein